MLLSGLKMDSHFYSYAFILTSTVMWSLAYNNWLSKKRFSSLIHLLNVYPRSLSCISPTLSSIPEWAGSRRRHLSYHLPHPFPMDPFIHACRWRRHLSPPTCPTLSSIPECAGPQEALPICPSFLSIPDCQCKMEEAPPTSPSLLFIYLTARVHELVLRGGTL